MLLVKPSLKYKNTFLKAEREFQKEGKSQSSIFSDLNKDFLAFIQKLSDNAEGKNLKKGYVPGSTYWLVDNGIFIGHITIRHRLNKKLRKISGHIGYSIRPSKRKKGYGTEILRLGLLKAKKMDFDKVLLTCDDNNIGSSKIIEANGGKLKKKIEHEGKIIRHYLISMK